MARARNIKPGFFKNEDLAECQPYARLCFAGLWTLADREGRLEDRVKRIKGELFPFESVEVEPLLAELEKWGFIRRYSVGGVRFIQITKFLENQAPHGTEKDGSIPNENGFITVHERAKNGYVTGKWRLERYPITVKEHSPTTTENSCLTVIGGSQTTTDNGFKTVKQASPTTTDNSSLTVKDSVQNTLTPDSGFLTPDSGFLTPDSGREAKQPTARGSRMPTDFDPNFEFARKQGIRDPEKEFEKFRDHWAAQPGARGVKLDWAATWRTWCRKAPEFAPRGNGFAEPAPTPPYVSPYPENSLEWWEEIGRSWGIPPWDKAGKFGDYVSRVKAKMEQKNVQH